MSDWLGLAFFVLLIAGGYFGLKLLANQPKRTEEEFERGVGESGGGLNATIGALNEALNPSEAKAKEVITQVKEGRFNKKKREGKGNGNLE